jgi:poly(glycerol-phosphate) alpha-glucosyltransferase
MRPLHLTWLLSRAGGGIPPAVGALAAAQRWAGARAEVAGIRDPGGPALVDGGTPALLFDAVGPLALGFAPRMASAMEALAPDVLHLHGLFTWPSEVARRFGRSTRRPVLISPHGMLEPWALANSAWKKRVFRFFVEDENLRQARCIHALCAPEAAQVRRLGFGNPIATVPNGVALGDGRTTGASFLERHPSAGGRRILLFLGRVHPKKGLLHLLDAWAAVKRDRAALAEWLLVVAGPDQLAHSAEVARRASERGLAHDALFTGALDGELKESALAAASGFVLPSFSEGFSVAVLEAMASRLPVLVTRQCNLDVEAFGGGILAEPDAGSVARQLHTFLDLTDAQRREMGERGRREVEARYTWPRVARDLLETYGWVLGHNGRPAFVEGAR